MFINSISQKCNGQNFIYFKQCPRTNNRVQLGNYTLLPRDYEKKLKGVPN